jgi:hypothetical protein
MNSRIGYAGRDLEAAPLAGEIQVSGNGSQFVAALIEADELAIDHIPLLLEKPWKWQNEYDAWIAAYRPIDPSQPDWLQFVKALDVIHEGSAE